MILWNCRVQKNYINFVCKKVKYNNKIEKFTMALVAKGFQCYVIFEKHNQAALTI